MQLCLVQLPLSSRLVLVEMYMYIRYMYMSYFILFSFNPEFLYSDSYKLYKERERKLPGSSKH